MSTDDSTERIESAGSGDLSELLQLYQHLNRADPLLPVTEELQNHWESILADPRLHYFVARDAGRIVSTCNLTIIPNLTREARPYGLIENVVTHPDYRHRGWGTNVLRHALQAAWERNCYKVMLLTGRLSEDVYRFYEKAGFLRGKKTGFIAYPPSGPPPDSSSL
ncbi:MAG: GNAT family N-acetyltransferase [Armatimonadetes bacterium]|nr:GNAT family N-acetyltransferase [Armatimonadota bacterium]